MADQRDEGGVYLRKFLSPIQPFLIQDGVSEVCVNQPGECWVEEQGARGMVRKEIPEMTGTLTDAARPPSRRDFPSGGQPK